MLYIGAEDIRRVFSMRDAIESDREAFIVQAEGKTQLPVRSSFNVCEMGVTSFMPGLVSSYPRAGLKIVSTYERNAAKGLPVVAGTVILMDPETGFAEAIMDGNELTKMRTGAVSGLASELLSNEDASIAALFGTGGQALSQLEAMLTVRKLEEVRIFDLNADRIAAFIERAADLSEKFGVKLSAASSSDAAIDGADIITCVTTAATPLFDGSRVKPGTHINAVGCFMPHKRELDETIVLRADRVFVDNFEACMTEAGDLLVPMSEGKFKKEDIAGELGDLILGRTSGRKLHDDITIMKTVGFATLDIVAGHNILKKASAADVGIRLQ